MFKWKRLGKIFNPADHNIGWMREYAQSPYAVVYDKYVRVFFCSRPPVSKDGQYSSYISFLDLDIKDITKVLNINEKIIFDLGGIGTFDEFGTNPISLIKNENKIFLYYTGWTRCESVPYNNSIGLAISEDNGKTFKRFGNGPILSFDAKEPFLIGSPRVKKINAKWYLWYVAGKEWKIINNKPEPIYKIRMASSSDGIKWQKIHIDLIEDKLGEDECQACPDVSYFNNRFNMFFSYRYSSNYKISKYGYKIGYASSTNLTEWKRDDSLAGFTTAQSGWDSEMVSYSHIFFLKNKIYMLYQGNCMGRDGIGIAIML
jgi:predicted GH43/DUF377 family glycosyl hydrolase